MDSFNLGKYLPKWYTYYVVRHKLNVTGLLIEAIFVFCYVGLVSTTTGTLIFAGASEHLITNSNPLLVMDLVNQCIFLLVAFKLITIMAQYFFGEEK